MTTRDVTGGWEGIYNYPRSLPPNGFVADLVEQAGALSGEIAERDEAGAAIDAIVEGERIGSGVRFTKRYVDGARAHLVLYTGTLSLEGDEIVGEWSIPGVWSGSFIMVRQSAKAAEVERHAAVEAR